MRVDEKTLRHVARIARLDLTDEEVQKFLPQLSEIIESFSTLDELDTKDIAPSFQPIPLRNALREDKIEPCLTQEQALENTKHKKDGFFKGPRAV